MLELPPLNPKNLIHSVVRAQFKQEIHVNNYLGREQKSQSMNVALRYLQGAAHECWIGNQKTEQGEGVEIWHGL